MAREPIPTWFFVVVVVRRGDRFLLVHEAKHGQLWYLPAGRVEAGEELLAAALRETLEEGGIPIAIDGIIRIEHTPMAAGARVRVILSAHPTGDEPPKSRADSESLEARWVTIEELDHFPLRGPDVKPLLEFVRGGATTAPITLLAREGEAYGE